TARKKSASSPSGSKATPWFAGTAMNNRTGNPTKKPIPVQPPSKPIPTKPTTTLFRLTNLRLHRRKPARSMPTASSPHHPQRMKATHKPANPTPRPNPPNVRHPGPYSIPTSLGPWIRAYRRRAEAPLNHCARGDIMRIAIAGADGRMGRMLIEAVAQSPDLKLTVALDRSGSPILGQDAGAFLGQNTGVLVTD